MSFIDVLIPLTGGVLLLAFPQWFNKPESPNFDKNKRLLKRIGIVLIGVSALYLLIIIASAFAT